MLTKILSNPDYVTLIMAFVVFLLVELIKQPIKLLTKKLPQKTRQLVNSTILLLPIGIGILGQYLFTHFYSHTAFDAIQGVLVGGEAMAMYGIVERVFGLKISDPYKSEDGALVVETANEIVATKKVNYSKLATLFKKLFVKKEDKEAINEAIITEQPLTEENDTPDANPEQAFEDKLKKALDKIK